ncbi:11843_t:CDS:2 [Acaulospora morrowiae]|uniref:Plasma membrane fusion protein PRM1 n=1 Tax=Acaulospora morrowiae TaxID=94023 RepID=A0A9N8VIV9_9GLOM|nr:11843_t:CDS:2 [Acaulospora morrowiae]
MFLKAKTPRFLSSSGASSTGSVISPSEEGFRQRSKTMSPKWQYTSKDDEEKLPASAYPEQLPSPCDVKPYIGLRAKLSLAWVAYPIISLFIIVLRLIFVMSSIQPFVNDVKADAMKACGALELATSTITSLPHFTADGFNRATVNVVNLSIKGFTETLDLSILALEGIIFWIIKVFRSTYKCLLELSVRASVSISLETVNALQQFTTTQLGTIKSGIDDEVKNLNSALDGIRSKVIGIQIPTVSISSADSLNQFSLPINIISGLETLNNSIPSMEDIESKLDAIISTPLEDLRKVVKTSMSNVRFDESLLPVPPKNKVEFCAQHLDLSVLDELAQDLIKAARIGIAIVAILGLLMIIANAIYIKFSHWRFMVHVDRTTVTIQLVNITYTRESTIELIKIADHPLISRWIIKSSKFFKRSENRNLYRWFWDYILHRPAIIVLLIGIVGILGIYVQILILNVVRQNYREPIKQTINTFGNAVMNLVNSQMNSTSIKFASDSNFVIADLEKVVNNDLFGWVNITTTAINNTLNSAVDEITGVINTVFGGVPILADAVQKLIGCLIFVKVQGIQKGLKFISDNAYVELPKVKDTVLVISQNRMQEVVNEATDKLVGPQNATSADSTSDNSGGEIGRIFDKYEEALRNELYVFWIMLSVYGIVVLMGFIRVAWFLYERRKKKKRVTDEKIYSDDEKKPPSHYHQSNTSPSPMKFFRNSVSSLNQSMYETRYNRDLNANIEKRNMNEDGNNVNNYDRNHKNPFDDTNSLGNTRKPPLPPKPLYLRPETLLN